MLLPIEFGKKKSNNKSGYYGQKVVDLRKLAQARSIPQCSRMNKAQLIVALLHDDSTTQNAASVLADLSSDLSSAGDGSTSEENSTDTYSNNSVLPEHDTGAELDIKGMKTRGVHFHTFVSHVPTDRERVISLYPRVSCEQQMEQSLTLDALVDTMRWNGRTNPFSTARIVSYYSTLVKLNFNIRKGDAFESIDPKSMPTFKHAEITNLEVPPCIWKLDSRQHSAWMSMLGRLVESPIDYNTLVGYHKTTNTFVFKLRPNALSSKILCWQCGVKHNSVIHMSDVIWGLTPILQYIS
jgi:hypothetical protein